jgi:hypothetical protein
VRPVTADQLRFTIFAQRHAALHERPRSQDGPRPPYAEKTLT